ncbi:hypothetical protein V2I01_29770 [Micromonospora sp. BRA006-A]|nr:hypothetical protein [Micromonospora sp. BRA006-A]
MSTVSPLPRPGCRTASPDTSTSASTSYSVPTYPAPQPRSLRAPTNLNHRCISSPTTYNELSPPVAAP